MWKTIWKTMLDAVGWSNRQAIISLPFLYVFIVLPFFLEGNALNNALLWLTGIVILLYAAETHGLRLEMVRQNEMSVQPLIIVTGIVSRENGGDRVVLTNIGRGPALFVQSKDMVFGEHRDEHFVARFENVDFIGANQTVEVAIRRSFEDEAGSPSTLQDFAAHLNPQIASKTYNVTITYEDMNGQSRESVVRMGKGGIRLLSQGKIP